MEEETINSSQLGTKDYWENLYQEEFDNYLDHHDPGEIWFGKGLVNKIVLWIKSKLSDITLQSKILDLGCGNGHLLYSLYQEGYTDLTGLDYADKSIKLVERMKKDLCIGCIKTLVGDVLTLFKSNLIPAEIKFNLIIDKGTFDAICLNPDLDLNDVKSDYLASLEYLLSDDGLFMIASCNWTKEELINIFTKPSSSDPFLSLIDEISTPQFSFGGRKGNNVTCLIFQRSSQLLLKS